LAAGHGLVRLLKDGRQVPYLPKIVADRRLKRRERTEKRANASYTNADESLLENYLGDVARNVRGRPPVDLDQLNALDPTGGEVNWTELFDAIRNVAPGNDGATSYHRAVQALITALFYPDLDGGVIEAEIDQGRKRVDLRYTNLGTGGFFKWLQTNYPPQPYVWCECKNYCGDIGNEALDQLSGRFAGATRGNFGLLFCRSFENKDLFVQRCRDTALAGRGFVLVLDDGDLELLVAARRHGRLNVILKHLTDRFGQIVS
jgi:hypothetical protein